MNSHMESRVRGRCISINGFSLIVANMLGQFEVKLSSDTKVCRVGDIVEVADGNLKILTENLTGNTVSKFAARILSSRRRKAIEVRERVELGIVDFFKSRGFTQTRTPTLVKSPGMETHIRPYKLATGEFIPTSPEFAMKKLLVGGLEKIFQICPAFRYEPTSKTHHPEFTILEWYRAYAGYEEIMNDFELLVEELAMDFFGKPEIEFEGKVISVKTPWPRLRVRDLFLQMVEVDLVKNNTVEKLSHDVRRLGLSVDSTDTWDDLYFKIWLNFIEDRLPKDKAVFVYRYPPSQSALAVIDSDEDGIRWARRFEPYAGGLELGNAFEELTDPIEQRKRFVEDMNLREEIYGPSFPKSPIDEEFIEALKEGMPPSGGIAVGVDRLVMLLANEPDIDHTIWLPSYVAE
jgi:lysyl-tRNA synthetase class 2